MNEFVFFSLFLEFWLDRGETSRWERTAVVVEDSYVPRRRVLDLLQFCTKSFLIAGRQRAALLLQLPDQLQEETETLGILHDARRWKVTEQNPLQVPDLLQVQQVSEPLIGPMAASYSHLWPRAPLEPQTDTETGVWKRGKRPGGGDRVQITERPEPESRTRVQITDGWITKPMCRSWKEARILLKEIICNK